MCDPNLGMGVSNFQIKKRYVTLERPQNALVRNHAQRLNTDLVGHGPFVCKREVASVYIVARCVNLVGLLTGGRLMTDGAWL